jgi:membrane protease YdiL (CAAX protease family)
VNDRYAQTVGFVVAGVGLAAAFLEWGGVDPLLRRLAAGFVGVALLGFGARRYGSQRAGFDYVAVAGGVGATLAAAAGIVSLAGRLPAGPALALFAGLGTVGSGAASVVGLDREGVRSRETRLVAALLASATALLFGSLLAAVAVAFVPQSPVWRNTVNTAVSSAGFALAGLAVIRAYDGTVDVSSPGRSDLLVAAVGVVAIFALHLGMNVVAEAFSLPQVSHGLVRTARDHPEILPPLAVLSYLFIAPGEELLARNGIQKYLYGAFSRRSAVVVASFVFASSHLLAYAGGGVSPGGVLVTLTRVFVVSLVLGVTYERTDDLFAPVVVHGTYNAVQFLLAYLTFT